MPTVINQRLRALLAQQHIELLTRVDRLVFQVGRLYSRMGRDLLRAVAVPEDDTSERVEAIMDAAFAEVDNLIREHFEGEILTSHRAAADSFIGAVPHRWFRKIHPFVVESYQAIPYGTMVLDCDRVVEVEEPVFDWGTLTPSRKREIIDELIFPGPTPERVDELLGHIGPGGMTWDERLKHWNDQARDDIRSTLARTLGDPDTIGIGATRKALEPSVGNVRFKAQRIARTEGRRMAELGQQEAIDEVSELIAGKQIISVLGPTTRPAHAARHGTVYRQRPDGSYVSDTGQTLPDLPDEPNGLCWAAPILKIPAELENDPEVVALLRNASGDAVNDPSAYDDWFANATQRERRRAVGAKKYRAVQGRTRAHGREPVWRDFLDRDGELSSIETLQRQPWDAWQNRRAEVDLMIADRTRILRQVAATGFEMPAAKTTAKKITFVLDRRVAAASEGFVTVLVDPKKFKAVWKRDPDLYVQRGNVNDLGRIPRIEDALTAGKPMEQPIAWASLDRLDAKGRPTIGFTDGRHRAALLIERGAPFPVSVEVEQAELLRKLTGQSR